VRRTFLSFALLALTACGSDAAYLPPAVVPVPSNVRLVGDAGESLSAGGTYEYLKANALVTVRPLGAQLAVRVVGDRVWDGFLALGSGETRLRAGTFASLTNTPDASGAGFRWSSQELTCASSVASVTIDSVKYDGATLSAIDLHFDQRCNGQSAALHGTVHWRAEDDPNGFGPMLPVPAALWRAPAGSTPAKGPYVYLDGEATLGPGVSLPQLVIPGPISVRTAGARLSITAYDPVSTFGMSGIFQEMTGVTSIQEGYSRDVRGLTELPSAGVIDVGVSGPGVVANGWDCASLTGWFVVDKQFYFQGNLTVIDLRFELRCGGFGAPLRGQLHWAESGA
jgi:hypothetical protein